jgi:hypothetical protein
MREIKREEEAGFLGAYEGCFDIKKKGRRRREMHSYTPRKNQGVSSPLARTRNGQRGLI